MAYAPERETNGTRQVAAAAGIALLSIAMLYLADDAQQRITQAFQASVLRPFIWTQETLAQARIRADQIDYLQSLWDRVTATADEVPVPDWHRTIIAKRLADIRSDPDSALTWETARDEIAGRLDRK